MVNEATLYRVYVARELLREGVEASRDPLPVGRMRALLSLDHVMELLLLTLLPVAGGAPKRDDTLPALITQLAGRRPALASHRSALERVRRLRDRVQHDGMIPSAEEARIAAVEVEGFARAAVEHVLAKTLDELSPIALVREAEARGHLRDAERHFRDGNYEEVCREAAVAFAVGSERAIQRLPTRGHRDQSAELVERLFHEIGQAARRASLRMPDHSFEDFAEELDRGLSDRLFFARDLFESFSRAILVAAFGVPPGDLRRFEEVTPSVLSGIGGVVHIGSPPPQWPPTKDGAQYALDFAVRALLRLESWSGTQQSDEPGDGDT